LPIKNMNTEINYKKKVWGDLNCHSMAFNCS
jgi:hypothetical protein